MFQGPKLLIDFIKTARVKITQRLELSFETITTAGAVSVVTPVTYVDSTAGVMAITLAAGYESQFKIIIMTADGGDATLTPASFANGTTITFDDALDMWIGIYHAGSWYNVGTPTATVA